jgi:FkbM family methyltransferase
VLAPAEAAARFGADVPFVVAVQRGLEVRRELRARGWRAVSAACLFQKYPEAFLPFYGHDRAEKVLEQADLVRRGLDVWADDASRAEYLAQIRFRMTLDELPAGQPPAETYFPPDLFELRDGECFVDGGAYDGDSIRAFLQRCPRFRKIIGFEPDPAALGRLRAFVAGLPAATRERVVLHELAVGNTTGKVRFEATGTGSSAVGAAGSLEIDCARLDEVLAGEQPTFIKLDIEGAEPDALAGGRETIARHLPVLAVCLYHVQDHLWKIPLFLRELSPRYRLHLRRYSDDCWEQVCYALPEDRRG